MDTDLFVETVRNGSGGRLVDDTQHVHAGDGSSVLGRLTLRVVEVGGNCDHSILERLQHNIYRASRCPGNLPRFNVLYKL